MLHRKVPPDRRTKRWYNADKKLRHGSKRGYRRKDVAAKHASYLTMKDGRHVSAYKCPYCPFYHIGHTPWEERPENA